MALLCDGLCDQGLKRKDNQDAIVVCSDGSRGLFLVADGMGGHTDGGRASGQLRLSCNEWWERFAAEEIKPDLPEAAESLKEALAEAEHKIWEETAEGDICGSTAVLLLIQDRQYVLINVGDSRCYQTDRSLFGCRVRQLTTDDVWENQPELTAGLSSEEIRSHAFRGRLVRAVGVKGELVCTTQTGTFGKGTLFALCSDGVYKYIGERNLESALKKCARSDDLSAGLERIRQKVYENHAPDNFSCVLVKIV